MSFELQAKSCKILCMGTVKGFKSLLVWQKSFILTKKVYVSFGGCRDFSFKDQIQRASISVMNNIAEGSARKSDKAFYNYLSIAKGSCAEVESMLLIGAGLNYLSIDNQKELLEINGETAKLLNGLMKKLKAQDP